MDLVIPLTTPVNVGESILALEFINDWVAVETGLADLVTPSSNNQL